MKFEISKEYWKIWCVILLMGFLIMTSVSYGLIEQRNEYAKLYFDSDYFEKDMVCNISLDLENVNPSLKEHYLDSNILIKEFTITTKCNDFMLKNMINERSDD